MSKITKKFFLLTVLFFFTLSLKAFSQKPAPRKDNPATINWQRYDQGLEQAKKDGKKVMVFFYTDWCGYCKRMNALTFTDEGVKKLLADKFVTVKVNGDSRNTLQVDKASITERELAAKYAVRGYPTIWFLEPTAEKISPLVGYVQTNEFTNMLSYVGGDWYKKISYDEYLKKKDELTKEKKEEAKTKSKK
ncbi:MAG: thioredoxin family protein [candidate division Zixibacteria bacterium]|nr:thioredoxin family protein [candidate division Zixibacteria bacterium]